MGLWILICILAIIFSGIALVFEAKRRADYKKKGNYEEPGTHWDTNMFNRNMERGNKASLSNQGVENPQDNALLRKQQKIEYKIAKQELKDLKNQARCPKCGSTSLSANKKGYGIGKGVIGAALTQNPFGLIAGNLGAKKVRVTCLNCGKQFWA